MGATNCPETPRQRMIGMMYLVLTAMLALNVSKEILNAFITVNEAMERTNENFYTKMSSTYESFAETAKNQDKAKLPYEKALKVQAATKKLVEYMEEIKYKLHSEVDGIPVDVVKAKKMTLEDLQAKDNYDKTSNYFIGQTENGKAYEMAKKFKEYKQELINIVGDTAYNINSPILTSGLQVDQKFTKDKITVGWEKYNFDGTVAAACFALLNKTIGEIRNIEYETVDYLFKAIDAKSHKFDQINAKVIPNSRIVFQGDKYEADVIVAAYDSRQPLNAYYGTGRDTVTEAQEGSLHPLEGEGSVKISIPCSAVGNQKFAGYIKMKSPDGKDEIKPFSGSYTVTKPTAAVAADKMNVFYAGIPNPVTIAAPVAPEQLKISWGGANAKSTGPGKYDVDIPTTLVGKDVTISVSAELEKGKAQSMGSTVFRVKSVPAPSVFVGGNLTSGKQPKDAILANRFVSAKMDQSFNYELPWKVLSYTVTFVKNGVEDAPISVTGAQFSDQVSNKIQNASSGTIIEFSNIKISSIAGTKLIDKPIVIRVR